MLAVNSLYCRELQEQFDSLDTYGLWSAKTLLDGLEHRQLKNILLETHNCKGHHREPRGHSRSFPPRHRRK